MRSLAPRAYMCIWKTGKPEPVIHLYSLAAAAAAAATGDRV